MNRQRLMWRRICRWAWVVVFVVFVEPTTIRFFVLRDRAAQVQHRTARGAPPVLHRRSLPKTKLADADHL